MDNVCFLSKRYLTLLFYCLFLSILQNLYVSVILNPIYQYILNDGLSNHETCLFKGYGLKRIDIIPLLLSRKEDQTTLIIYYPPSNILFFVSLILNRFRFTNNDRATITLHNYPHHQYYHSSGTIQYKMYKLLGVISWGSIHNKGKMSTLMVQILFDQMGFSTSNFHHVCSNIESLYIKVLQ